ncbi:virion-associated protein [Agrobacterium phage Milano]|uniref:Virion-associated protein n=1 Tax=Agrobacterium phage Milano TaxID=2557550 RepID=A0ACD6BA88_9CAUD|nr:Chain f1, Linking protein 1, gp16 [Agrobacterium phage Milano]8FWG_f2 Chain f2, Linking protein 1, gp16 [Agrobacterium phage Milano]8FWG_f5 Chain f5, Linking protein 1, gp16 [Agrobacterium phage Milano]8FWG_f6 Chain f6, Linking protein 1, gp16 [Agrobacterium phage Milano]8FWG_f7 Chain f7, Linking protein 1, gp16 [Agrobacterium phage Milano]8FXP_0 Chain 0, Linking protein 1, gp16 [Agrobacterium phage Milano]8FXP_0A Chain 0A, Linking protein 1, gp16 [Agrobacterium phage Milano]8FXP_0B Chain
MDCRNLCGAAAPSRLVQPGCFICRGVAVSIPPAAPGPATSVFDTPPSTFSLRPDGTIIAGTGIRGDHASVGTDGTIEMFIVPFIGDVTGSELTHPYAVELQDGEELAIAFGVTLKSGYGARITEYYDVSLFLENGGNSKELTLQPANTKSGYVWSDGHGYNITDSDGDLHTVQNVTRPVWFEMTEPGIVGVIMEARYKATGLVSSSISITVNVTYAD